MANEEMTETFAEETVETPAKRGRKKVKEADADVTPNEKEDTSSTSVASVEEDQTEESKPLEAGESESEPGEGDLDSVGLDSENMEENSPTLSQQFSEDPIIGADIEGEEMESSVGLTEDGYYPEDDQGVPDVGVIAEAVTQVLAGIYQKRKVFRATDEQRREMYGRKEKVIAERGKRVITAEDELKAEYDILLNANRSIPKKIVYGTISGVCNDEKAGLCATVNLDNTKGYFKILIPAIELFPLDMQNYIGKEKGLEYLTNELTSRIGGHTGFTVYNLNESEKTAYGSRVEAMSIEAYRWYRKKNSDGLPEMVNGLRAMAEIVSVRRDRVKVNVLGAEATILSKDMSWLSLGVLTDEFKKGQTFPVRVDNIKEFEYRGGDNRKYVLVSISASKKAAEPNPADLYYDMFNIGDISEGTIKNITETGVYVNLQNKMDCLCPHPVSDVPVRNRPCCVQIERKNDAKKFIYGTIKYMG